MATLENKYKAAKILLDEMTRLMVDNADDFVSLAMQHRAAFDKATEGDAELHAAGIEVAREMQEMS